MSDPGGHRRLIDTMTTAHSNADANGRNSDGAPTSLPAELSFEIHLRRPETIAHLLRFTDLRTRHDEAVAALEVGLEALDRARGQVDAVAVRDEVDRLLLTLQAELSQHAAQVPNRIGHILGQYFHPESGQLEARLRKLLAADGDLERVLQRAVAGDGSQLARTLDAHVGPRSPLMQLLDPKAGAGLANTVAELVDHRLHAQRRALLHEFSLDNDEGALRRLVRAIESRHGKLEQSIETNLAAIVREFSLDEQDSALNRLVQRVEQAQQTIAQELSLQNEASALAQMRTELRATQGAVRRQLTLDDPESPMSQLLLQVRGILDGHHKEHLDVQREIVARVASLEAKRKAAKRGTEHGHTFEGAVCAFVTERATAAGDIAINTSNKPGLCNSSRKGDLVVELGPESPAAGARIVVEAKEQAGVDLAKARKYLEVAKPNRDARMGIFVFSKATAPDELPSFSRCGDDIYVVWDADDPGTDVVLDAAVSLARGLSVREARHQGTQQEQVDVLTKAITEIEQSVDKLGQIEKSANTIQKASENILDRIRIDRGRLFDEIGHMKDALAVLRTEGQ